MLEIKDIEKLAKLARIQLTQEEMEKLLKEVEPILGYVAQLKEVVSTISEENHEKSADLVASNEKSADLVASNEKSADLVARKAGELRNVMRNDENPIVTGTKTKDIVADMPDSKDNYLKVKKILQDNIKL